jgi:primosomal protein N' (replication factor Y) (superfamily II helicase)
LESPKYANIALNFPIDTLFTYSIPSHLKNSAEPGKRALISFGKKTVTGVIMQITDIAPVKNVKSIKSILDEERIITEELISFCRWVSDYYIAPIGVVIFSSIPRNINIRSEVYYSLHELYKENLNALNEKAEVIIDLIRILEKKSSSHQTKSQLEHKLNVKLDVLIKKLIEKNILTAESSYSKPTKEKYIKIIKRNFNPDEIESIIIENKIRSEKQKKLLQLLTIDKEIGQSILTVENKIPVSAINSLFIKRLIEINEKRFHREIPQLFYEDDKKIKLNEKQNEAITKINDALGKDLFKPFLLYGITGSGKTEVYICAIENVLRKNKTAIVLVPEISLTPQLIFRFKKRFGNSVGVIHSKLSDGEKLDTYDRIRNGTYKIIVGARSALFAPLKNIGMIVVDEEHDSSYKQENMPRYNGRDAAIYRAYINNAVVILGSATPSLESFYNSQTGKYEFLELPERASNITLPEIKIIDLLKRDKDYVKNLELDPEESFKRDYFDKIDKVRIKFLSKELIIAIGEKLEKKENIILLQNRRGYHSYLECMDCGNVETCSRCSISLTYHKAFQLLKCHFCGLTRKLTGICSVCGSSKVIPKGAGTERVEEEIEKIFPFAKVKRMDSDTMTSKGIYQEVLRDFYEKKIDILVGTQMISKGLDFPHVTLVGVVNADIGLLNPDFRATERTFQILTQVSGRSGRSNIKGEVFIQTNHSDYFVFDDVKNHDYMKFYNSEIKTRKALNYPPFSRISVIETKSLDRNLAESKIKEIYNFIKELDNENKLELLPPGPPLFSKIRDRFRFHLLIKSSRQKDPSGKYMNSILKDVRLYSVNNFPSKVQVIIDVDAVSLL